MTNFRAMLLAAIVSLAAACSSTPSKPVAAAAPPPAAMSVAGNWMLTIDSQMGSQDSKLVLKQTGKDLSGTLESPQGTADVTGTLEGKDIKFGFNFSGQGVELRIDFVGTADGQSMNGKAVFGTYGEGTFKAKRQ
jgi:hypothetical protein